ncbi:MAG: TonB-dependent receptor [Pseudomonadota bacterium]
MRTNRTRNILAALFATTALYAAPASAQTAAADAASESDDIVVTAQKREENLQDVPISVQVLGTRRLDQLNITNFNQYTQMLPSVAFQSSQPGVTTVYMRGVASGGDGNHSGSLPSVGVYLDEQPVTTIGGTLDVHIYDIARIESLAGPQGTLYGASSQAGTIRIITNRPDASGFDARFDSEINTVHSGGIGGRVEGMVNLPLSAMAALRVVGFYQRDAGYIDNIAGTRRFCGGVNFDVNGNCVPDGIAVNNTPFVEKDYNDVEVYGGRAALQIDLNDSWTVTPTVLYQEMSSTGSFGFDSSLGDLQVQRFGPEFRHDRFVQAALTIEGQIGNWDLTYAGAYLDRKDSQSSDYVDYAETYDSLYSSVGGLAGYFYINNAAGDDINPRQQVIGSDHFKKLSQEFRIASPQDARFRVVAGVFFQRQSNQIFQDYQVAGLAPQVSVNGRPGTLWLTRQERVDRDYAAFGEASFDITDRITLTAGGRLFKYDNDLIGFFGFGRDPAGNFTTTPYNAAGSSRTGVAGCFTSTGVRVREAATGGPITLIPPIVSGTPCTNLGVFANGGVSPVRAKDDGFTHRVNLNWDVTDDVLLYATWSRGFRPGGINRRADVPPYAADFLTNYEIGWKTTFPGSNVRFNGAIYQQEWDNFQFSFLGVNSFTVINNGPNARIRGIEADINYSVSGFNFTAGASYTDAETRQNLCAIADPTFACTGAGNSVSAPAGTRLPITPRFKGNVTARYAFDLGQGRAHVQGVVAHQSSASADIRTGPAASLGRLEGFTTVGLSFGIDWSSWTFEAFASNLFDERGQLTRFQQCGACSQRTYIVPIQPRTLGLRAGYRF